jgi:hypothetical protein
MVLASLRSRLPCTGRFHTRVDDWYHALAGWQQLAVMGAAVTAALWGEGVYADLGAGDVLQSVLLVAVPFALFFALTLAFRAANRRLAGE